LFQGIIEAGIKRQQGDKTAAATILASALRNAGVLTAEALGSGGPEKVFEAVKSLTVADEPSVRIAAMGLDKLLHEPGDSGSK
jgi:hypothetical protein